MPSTQVRTALVVISITTVLQASLWGIGLQYLSCSWLLKCKFRDPCWSIYFETNILWLVHSLMLIFPASEMGIRISPSIILGKSFHNYWLPPSCHYFITSLQQTHVVGAVGNSWTDKDPEEYWGWRTLPGDLMELRLLHPQPTSHMVTVSWRPHELRWVPSSGSF